MARAKWHKAVEILPHPKMTHLYARQLFHRTDSTKRTQPSQRGLPGLLLARVCRVFCALYLASGHQSWKLCLLARPHLWKCDKILSCLGRVLERTYEPDQTRFALHQVQTSQQGSATWYHQSTSCRKIQGTLCRQ